MANKVISPAVDTAKLAAMDLRAGDSVRVWQKIKEKDKFRLQAFEGLVLARKHGSQAGATFTVRKVVDGVGVERIFPLYSPTIDKIELVKRSKVRRAKLYFIREKAAKEIRHQMRRIMDTPDQVVEEVPVEAKVETKIEPEVKK
jgi:large subunit ribosomal protein L19